MCFLFMCDVSVSVYIKCYVWRISVSIKWFVWRITVSIKCYLLYANRSRSYITIYIIIIIYWFSFSCLIADVVIYKQRNPGSIQSLLFNFHRRKIILWPWPFFFFHFRIFSLLECILFVLWWRNFFTNKKRTSI